MGAGLFLHTVAIRADLSGDPALTELLDRVRVAAVGAYPHQGMPFAQVVAHLRLGTGCWCRAMQPVRAARRDPLDIPQ